MKKKTSLFSFFCIRKPPDCLGVLFSFSVESSIKKLLIITAEVCPDHVHMLIEIPPKDTAGKNAEMIRNYIDEQLKEDHLAEQLTIDKINPVTGSKK